MFRPIEIGTSIAASVLRNTSATAKQAETQQSYSAVQAKVAAEADKRSVSQLLKSPSVEIRSDNEGDRGGSGNESPFAVSRKPKRANVLDPDDYSLPSDPGANSTIDISV